VGEEAPWVPELAGEIGAANLIASNRASALRRDAGSFAKEIPM